MRHESDKFETKNERIQQQNLYSTTTVTTVYNVNAVQQPESRKTDEFIKKRTLCQNIINRKHRNASLNLTESEWSNKPDRKQRQIQLHHTAHESAKSELIQYTVRSSQYLNFVP
jgi:hypothetical protein